MEGQHSCMDRDSCDCCCLGDGQYHILSNGNFYFEVPGLPDETEDSYGAYRKTNKLKFSSLPIKVSLFSCITLLQCMPYTSQNFVLSIVLEISVIVKFSCVSARVHGA
jgi:hypothetical protein